MLIDKIVHIVFEDSDPILVYSTIESVQVPDEEQFNVFLMKNRKIPWGFIGIIVGLDTAKFIAEKYYGEYKDQCAIVAEYGGKTVYWPELETTV